MTLSRAETNIEQRNAPPSEPFLLNPDNRDFFSGDASKMAGLQAYRRSYRRQVLGWLTGLMVCIVGILFFGTKATGSWFLISYDESGAVRADPVLERWVAILFLLAWCALMVVGLV